MIPASSAPALTRALGPREALSLVVGRIIGSGIFRTPGPIMALVLSPGPFFAVWLLAGAMTMLSALCYAELVAMLPKSGGPYAYLKEAYPPWWAFLRGWAMFFVSETASIAAVALVFAQYSAVLWSAFWRQQREVPLQPVHRDQRRNQQQFVGKRIKQPTEIGDESALSRQMPVPVVGDRGDQKERKRHQSCRPRCRERQPGNQRRQCNAADGDRVRQVH